MHGYTATTHDAAAAAPTSHQRWTGAPGAAGPGRPGRVYAHLDDLVAQSTPQLDIHAPVLPLLRPPVTAS